MKRILLIGCIAGFIASCQNEDDSTPGGGGTPDSRNYFKGEWTCTESGGVTPFSISIDSHGSADTIYINNFANYGGSAVALGLVSGLSLSIPGQNIGITSIFVQGSGVMNSQHTRITMDYVADGDTISAECTR
jgi:hypothetical protein